MSFLRRVINLSALRRITYSPQTSSVIRSITTSNKKSDTTTVGSSNSTEEATEPKKKRYFYDYGFEGETEEEERNEMHSYVFIYVTLGMVIPTFYYYYIPKPLSEDWAQREAYLELKRRESLGLPLVDPNYVDPSTIYLPTDEELGDAQIII